jgi:Phosphoadenosine phosphosulfate reductase family
MVYMYIASMIRVVSNGRSEVKDVGPSTEPDLKAKSPSDRLRWAVESFPKKVVLTTSFGAQSAAFLHWASQISPTLPVIFIDTGYHFPETLAFASELTSRLGLNLKTYRPLLTPTQIESQHGLLWLEGPSGLEFGSNPCKGRSPNSIPPSGSLDCAAAPPYLGKVSISSCGRKTGTNFFPFWNGPTVISDST